MQKIGLVIPCYNEADRLHGDDFLSFLSLHQQYQILFVNDGSSDSTQEVIDHLAEKHPSIHTLNLAKNEGKAEAVRSGILHMIQTWELDIIGFLDADLATPLEEILHFERLMLRQEQYQIVLGSRWKRLGSKIERSTIRHYLGRIFATVVSILFKLSVYDTQCGAKLMRNQNLYKIFEKPFLSPWFFDIEILCRYRQQYPGIAVDDWAAEMPLYVWHEVGGSRIKAFDFLTAPLALLKIRKHYPF